MKRGSKKKLTFWSGCLCAVLAVFLLVAAVISPAGKRHSPQTTISLGHGLAIALKDDGTLVLEIIGMASAMSPTGQILLPLMQTIIKPSASRETEPL